MSDFLIDCRPQEYRSLRRAAEQLTFAEDTRAIVIDRPRFGLVITHTGDAALWAPHCESSGSLVAVAGRPAFDDSEWESGLGVEGTGGLAARIIHHRVQTHGLSAVETINGSCTVIVHDAVEQCLHLVTDTCGASPAFEVKTPEGHVYCSHPDVLADVANERHRIDESSLAEFVLSGTVTPPYSYYQRIRALDCGSIVTLDLRVCCARPPAKRRYFQFVYGGDAQVPEEELARQLAVALQRAVQRRTLPRLGPKAIALSGGLDSRVVLACALDRQQTLAFSCYDDRNREIKTAEAIARSLSARFLPLPRGGDYYADHAERGIWISGGMGNFANNHFLGVIPVLKREGTQTLLTGCYCDYLFKALPLNRQVHWLTRRETLGRYRDDFYFDHVFAPTSLAQRARQRWESRIPPALRAQDTPSMVFEVEARRTFPLSYEGDNQQRLVPQRMTGWSPPFLDRDVLDVYCRLPYTFKFNRSLFKKTVTELGAGLTSVADANTGARPDAAAAWEWVRGNQIRLQRAWHRLSRSTSTDGSWPDWQQYLTRSSRIDALWRRPNRDAMDLLCRILGSHSVGQDLPRVKREQPFLFIAMLTAKIWLDQRASCGG